MPTLALNAGEWFLRFLRVIVFPGLMANLPQKISLTNPGRLFSRWGPPQPVSQGVPQRHFHLYLGEVAFRFNHRDQNSETLKGLTKWLLAKRRGTP